MRFDTDIRIYKQKLKCYVKEILTYKHAYLALITPTEARKIIKLIERRYKLKIKNIRFDLKSKWCSGWAYMDNTIAFKKRYLNILIVCHEVSHLIAYRKGINNHSYKFYRILKQVINFIVTTLTFKIGVFSKEKKND